jgi:hypothetical protein
VASSHPPRLLSSGTMGQFGIGLKALLVWAAQYGHIMLPVLRIVTTSLPVPLSKNSFLPPSIQQMKVWGGRG